MIDITTGGEGIGVQIKEPEHDAEIWPWGKMRAEGWCTTELAESHRQASPEPAEEQEPQNPR